MDSLVRRITGIREGEGFRSVLMFVYIFMIIASLLIVKPVRNSLFLTRYGASQLPFVYLMVAVVAALVTFSYARLIQRFRFGVVLIATLVSSILTFVFFLRALESQHPAGWLIYAFYVWVQIFGMITTTQFWLLANYVFNAREAKRLFGFIGAGAISGGIAGGYLTRWLVPVVGTVDMILICIAFLAVNVLLLRLIWIRSAKQKYREKRQPQARVEDEESPLRVVVKLRYLRLVAGIVGIGVIVATLVDYQFSAISSQLIRDQDSLTGFFGFWMSNLSIVSLAIQFFLTSRILTRMGVASSLFFLPLAILGGAFGIFVYPGLWSAVLIKVADGGFKQSVNKVGVEMLYLPLPSRVKNQAKAFIDVFVDSFASGIGGVLLILFSVVFAMNVRGISLVNILFIAVWIGLVLMVRKEYINAFRLAIEKRVIDVEDQSANPDLAGMYEYLAFILQKGSHRNMLYVLHLIESSRNPHWVPHLKPLFQHWSPDIRAEVLRLIPNFPREDFSSLVEPLITDPDDDVRELAIEWLFRRSTDRIATLKRFLYHESLQVRASALYVAATEASKNSAFRRAFPLETEFRNLIDEVQRTDHDNKERDLLKIYAARIVGVARDPALYPYLHVLLKDKSREVVRAAVSSAGNAQAPEFFPVIIQHLDYPGVRKTARNALSESGEVVLRLVWEHFSDSTERKSVRQRIPAVLAGIGTQNSMDALTASLDEKDLFLRYEVIKALSKLRTNYPELKINSDRITNKILEETQNYDRLLAAMNSEAVRKEMQGDFRADQARRLLIRALEERLEENLERIFRLLGLKYPPRDIFNAYRGIISRKEDMRANAVEFLDNILDAGLKKYILPIVETRQTEAMINTVVESQGRELEAGKEALIALLEGDDPWLQVCVLYLLATRKSKAAGAYIAPFINSPDQTVRETAEFALKAVNFPLQ